MTDGTRYAYGYEPDMENVTAATIHRMALRGGERVLDLGSGPGVVASRLASEHGREVTCVDVDAAALGLARDRGVQEVVEGDLTDPGLFDRLGDRQWDVVVLADVLEHLVEPGLLLERIHDRELLAPGGHLVVSLPNASHVGIVAALCAGEFPYRATGLLDSTHLRFFTLRSVRDLLEAHGFRVTAVERTTRRLEETEFAWLAGALDVAALQAAVAANEEHLTYQLVLRVEQAEEVHELAALRRRATEAEAALADARAAHADALDALRAELEEARRAVRTATAAEVTAEDAATGAVAAEADAGPDAEAVAAAEARATAAEAALGDARRRADEAEAKLAAVYEGETFRLGRALLSVPRRLRRGGPRGR